MTFAQIRVVTALGVTQTLGWASSYYLAAIIADPAAAELGFSRADFFAMFSGALLLTALLGPAVGRAIDRRGGRGVLVASNIVFAAGLALLGASRGALGLAAAWALMGLGMALGLYDTGFATLAGLYGWAARGPMTGITLLAGFASTVGWPVTNYLTQEFGWREACLAWAALHLVLGLPINRLLIPAAPPPSRAAIDRQPQSAPAPRGATLVLAFVFAATWFISTGMAALLPQLFETAGTPHDRAIAAAAWVGPAQVGARLLEFLVIRRVHPLHSARLACLLHPLGAAALSLLGGAGPFGFALLHGAGNGMLTIAKGTLPLAIFGPVGYGLRTGLLSAPARIGQAAAPLVFAVLIERFGTGALLVSAGLSLASLAALTLLPAKPRGAVGPVAAPGAPSVRAELSAGE
jgi:Major Facilitator Superfamily